MKHVVVVGAGAAGFFAAISAARSGAQVTLLEKTNQVLAKVRISGGGRCNVTHSCFEPRKLVENYPRGHKELLGPFSRFGPQDTIEWFESRGCPLKTEADGRIFPVSNSSESIISVLTKEAQERGVHLKLQSHIATLEKGFVFTLTSGERLECDKVILATGSSPQGYQMCASLGHTLMPAVPSLFTFNVPTSPFRDLSGIAVEKVEVRFEEFKQKGPLLLTHFGFSGPAILKLSALAARALHAKGYKADFTLNWAPDHPIEELLLGWKEDKYNPFGLPKNLWKRFLERAGIEKLSETSKAKRLALAASLRSFSCHIEGKTTHKEEFVTCGGVLLKEVNFKTMESRLVPGLHFAGEILDIDGVTGGFNFQNAWTTGWIAGASI